MGKGLIRASIRSPYFFADLRPCQKAWIAWRLTIIVCPALQRPPAERGRSVSSQVLSHSHLLDNTQDKWLWTSTREINYLLQSKIIGATAVRLSYGQQMQYIWSTPPFVTDWHPGMLAMANT